MLGLFGRKWRDRSDHVTTGGSSGPLISSWREEINFTNSVTNVVKELFEDRRAFALLGAAVFTLQQDMKQASRIDLWAATNLEEALFIETRMRLPRPSGPNEPGRLLQAIEALREIMTLHGEYWKKHQDREDPLYAEALAAGLLHEAAAIWLLTVMSPSEGGRDMVRLAATSVWLRLGMISAHELRDLAEGFTGICFKDVRCQEFALGDWPILLT
jgi:hypothetical protein